MKVAIGVKMIAFTAMTLGAYNEYRGWIQPINENPETEGYLVEYLGQGNKNHDNHDNYISWTLGSVFDAAYFPIEVNDKISKNDVEQFMVQGIPTKLGAKTTALTVTTLTGFDIIGLASCVDPKNYDIEIGSDIAKREVVDKLWGHLGFVLQWAKNGLKAKSNS